MTTAALAHALEIEPRRSSRKTKPSNRPALKLAMLAASLSNQPKPEEIADLVKRGRELFAAGKIRDARILLKRAAEAGDASAALALATTYDPAELEKLEARDADPDITEARAWYQKAKGLGSTSAGGIPQNTAR